VPTILNNSISTGYPAPGILTAPWKLTAKFPQLKQGWTDLKNRGKKLFFLQLVTIVQQLAKLVEKHILA
jgi:hypothetical protein